MRVFGARISRLDGDPNGRILVFQTSKQSEKPNAAYTIDKRADGKKMIFRHVDRNDDSAIAQAIRDALQGQL